MTIRLLLTLTLLILSLGAFAQERIALVIGNSEYQVSPLKNALNDAEDIAQSLKELDFKVTLVKNASKRAMKDAIYEFSSKLGKDTVGLFYYAGHAVQYHGENYLIPINALSSIKELRHLEDEAVRSGIVSREMSASQSQLNFIFLDACRDNPLPAESRGIVQGLAKSQNAEGSLIAYSTSPGRTAEDGTGRNSPYTKNLLKYINTPNQPIELMLKEVKNAVSKDTNGGQLPWYESSITGNFCFKTTNEGCAETTITVIDNPYFNGLYDLEVIDLENGDHYVGQVKDGKFNGKGILTYKTGAKYQGEFLNGNRHGSGAINQLNGNSFEGNFINDKRHGKGTLRWVSGSYIETDWELGKRVYLDEAIYTSLDGDISTKGYGTFKEIDGAHYEGEFLDGWITGQGVFTKFDGLRYEGNFTKGYLNGPGVKITVTGDYIEAEFINDVANGQGKIYSPDGNYYEGNFEMGFITGKGINEYFDGTRYEGNFDNSVPHGNGEMWFADGSHFVGELSNGNPVNGKYTWANGDSWQGPMLNLMKHGYGIYTYSPDSGGGSVEGDFINNYPNGYCHVKEPNEFHYIGNCKMSSNSIYNGKGKMIYPDGSIYNGDVNDGRWHGNGVFTDTDGVRSEGNFIDGSPNGEFKVTLQNGKIVIENY